MHVKGGRPLRSIGPSKLTNYNKAKILNALTNMTPDERHATHIETFINPPMNERGLADIENYKDIFRAKYPDEFAKAEKAAQRAAATRIVADKLASEAYRLAQDELSAPPEYHRENTLLNGLPNTTDDYDPYDEFRRASVGGKTRRNRRRRRNRRSLKRKHSRRR